MTHFWPITFIVALIASSQLPAQSCTGKPVPGERTDWFPRSVVPGPDPASAADRAAVEATLTRVESLVRKTAYGTPRGFEAYPFWHYAAPLSRIRLSKYSYTLVLQCPGRKATGGDGQAAIVITINPSPQLWSESDRPRIDANGDSIYTNRIRTANQFGSTVAFGDLNLEGITSEGLWVLFTTGDESPTLPVSREEFLRLVLFEVEGTPGTKKSAYQEYLDGAANRKKANDDVVAMIAKSDPAKADKLRKDLEKAERDNGELVRDGEKQGNAGIRSYTDRIRGQIAAMTPEERASPAYISGATDFVSADSPYAHAIVRMNPAFYRARTSPLEPRLVVVWLLHNYEALNDLNRRMYRELDWAAVKALVNPPKR